MINKKKKKVHKELLVIFMMLILINISWAGWQEVNNEDCWICSCSYCDDCYEYHHPGPDLIEETIFHELGSITENTVFTGASCDSRTVVFGCDSACIVYEDGSDYYEWNEGDCDFYEVNIPDFIGSTASIDWDVQGPDVVVTGCGDVFPAKGEMRVDGSKSLGGSKSEDLVEYYYRECFDSTIETYEIATRKDTHFYMAIYDPNIFTVNNQRESPMMISAGGPVKIGLVNNDCDTLDQALDATVEIYHRKLQEAYIHFHNLEYQISCSGSELILPIKSELEGVELIAEVGVKFVPDNYLECQCPDDEGTPDSCSSGGGGCGSGSCSSGDGPGGFSLSVGSSSVEVGYTMKDTLSTYGSPDVGMTFGDYGIPSMNVPGDWVRASHYPYQADMYNNVNYSVTENAAGDEITKIDYSFDVIVGGTDTYYYEYELTGSWKDQYNVPGDSTSGVEKTKEELALEEFLVEAREEVQLKYVKDSSNNTLRDFQYDVDGKLTKQTSYDENGNPNGYIKYDYSGDSLVRIWLGNNESLYAAYPNTPSGGRWVTVSYDAGEYINSVEYSSCSSCQATRQYVKGGATGTQLTAVKDSSGTILQSYDYDNRGNFESYSIGDGVDELKVTEWERSYYDPNLPQSTSGMNIMVRKDFVDNTNYRVKIYFADDNGEKTKEIHYHQLQDDSDSLFHGPYSVYRYSYVEDETFGLRYFKKYPKGNKLVKYLDDNGNVTKVQWDGAASPNVEYQYILRTRGNSSQYLVEKEINAYGGTTTYSYDGFDVQSKTSPSPGGMSGIAQQVVNYVYEDNRIKYEYKKASDGSNVYTRYVYDYTGNLKRKHENCTSDDCTGTNPTTGLITYYDYNEYNELKKTTYPSGKVEKKFYSDLGTLIAEAVYDDDASDSAVSATIYEYIDGKLTRKKTAKMDTSFTFTETEAQTGGSINWVSEKYEYDVYGRREAVISDETGQALRTEYTYNNQSEIIKVMKPDKRYKKTKRNGRGLVMKEITGVEIDGVEHDKATTQYFYDLNGNLEKKISPTGVTEIYQYNFKDQMTKSRKSR